MHKLIQAILLISLFLGTFSADCGTVASNIGFQVSFDTTTKRTTFQGQSCPGYDWTSQTTPNKATQQCTQFQAPTNPTISTTPTKVKLNF
jgi:hypothetical protein